jgi:hypothetical protein
MAKTRFATGRAKFIRLDISNRALASSDDLHFAHLWVWDNRQQTDRIQPGGKEVGTSKHTLERGGLGNHAELNQVKNKVKLEE